MFSTHLCGHNRTQKYILKTAFHFHLHKNSPNKTQYIFHFVSLSSIGMRQCRRLCGILITTLSSLPQPSREMRNHCNLPLQSIRLKYESSEFFFCFDLLNLAQWRRWGCPFPSILNMQFSFFSPELKHVENSSNQKKCYVRCMLGRSLLKISVCF